MQIPARTGAVSLRALTAMLILVLAAPVASAAEDGWRARPHLTGDWGGTRTWLAEHGVLLFARYTSGFWSNLDGGFETGTTYEGFAEWGTVLDLDRLVGWRGGAIHINWYSYHGGHPSTDLIGTFDTMTLSGHETAQSVRFYEILLRQEFWDGRLLLKAGQLAADADFFATDNAGTLLNGTFGFLGLGRTLMPFFPLAAPGLYFRARTRDAAWSFHAGVYTADSGPDESSNIGFGYSFDNGVSVIAELRLHRQPFGLPGTYLLGVSATTAEVESYTTGEPTSAGYGLYLALDQTIMEMSLTRPGLGAFLRAYGAVTEETAIADWYVDFGLNLVRPLPGRVDDVLSIGVAHVSMADDYLAAQRAAGNEVTTKQTVLEMTYRWQSTGWLTLQPNMQLYFDPHYSLRNAVAIGLRAVLTL